MNPGASPIDAATPVGALRLTVGDTESQPLQPPVPGMVDYAVWSDGALIVALANAQSNNLRAAGNLYRQLAADYAQTGRSVKTDDLQLNTLGRGDTLLKVAQSFIDEAQAAENAATNDFFQIVPFAGRAGRALRVRPEGTPRPLCAPSPSGSD